MSRERASVPCWLLTDALLSVPLQWLLQRAPHNVADGFSLRVCEGETKRKQARWKPQFFCNLILKMKSHNTCCNLFIRMKSLNPTHHQGEEITQRCDHQETGVIGSHFRGSLSLRCKQRTKKVVIYFLALSTKRG